MDESRELEVGQQSRLLIGEIKAIERSGGGMISTRDEIKDYVEPPLVEACELLWDLNIRTVVSSANAEDVGRNAYIEIAYELLI